MVQGTDETASAGAEWKAGGSLVVAATAGMSLTPLMIYPFGLFIQPLQAEFGWSRAVITSGLILNSVMGVLLATFVGGLLDRVGARLIGIFGAVLFCLAFAALATTTASPLNWWILWLVLAIGGQFANPTIWTAAVASRFNTARGLALGVVLSGSSISAVLAPLIGGYLIEHHGWRWGFLGLAGLWFVVALPLLLAFFYNARDLERRKGQKAETAAPAHAGPALRLGQTLKSPTFLKLGIATAIVLGSCTAAIIHFVPLVSAEGLERSTAAQIASVVGIAALVGRLAAGWMLDRFNGVIVGGVVFTLPALAFAGLLLFEGQAPLAIAVASTLGFCVGAGIAVSSYLASRFFGMRNFGALFGAIMAMTALVAGFGPMIAGHVQDEFGNYDPALWTGLPLALLAGLLVFSLGRGPGGRIQAAAAPA